MFVVIATETILPPDAVRAIRTARRVVVITGAGVSAESGIRTFRDTMDGLWKDFDAQTLATPQAFDADPSMITRWYDWRRLGCLAAEPNPGHKALARLEREITSRGGQFMLLTQNVDRLHQKAGSVNVVELHGSIIEWRCTISGQKLTPPPTPFEVFPPQSPFVLNGLLRPDVVWFGEMLPADALTLAEASTTECDVFISVGTSAAVYPAASFVQVAASQGAMTLEVNRDPTPISGKVDRSIQGLSGIVLPALVSAAFGPG
jgi:NAD-dependent deacetylase